jgi:hypothetical protein
MKKPSPAPKVSLSKYFLGPCEPSRERFPSLSAGLSRPSPQEEAAVLSPFVPPLIAHEAATPSCVRCRAPLSWEAWARDLQMLPLGLGKFYARCEACREKDATFKDA